MLQLPDSEGRQKEAFGPREGTDGGQFFFAGGGRLILPRAATARLCFADTTSFFADGEVTGVVHITGKSSFQASGQAIGSYRILKCRNNGKTDRLGLVAGFIDDRVSPVSPCAGL